MNKLQKTLAAATAGATILLATALPVFAGAGKAPLYGPADPGFSCGAGGNAVGTVMGFVVMNTNGKPGGVKDVMTEVSIKGGAPNATYDIWVNQDPGDCPTLPTGTLTTNGQGNGNAKVVEPKVPGATNFWVSATEVGGVQVLRSPAVTLD